MIGDAHDAPAAPLSPDNSSDEAGDDLHDAIGLGPIDEEFIEALIGVTLEAGRAIMAVHASAVDVEWKGDGSPVTEADQKAEAIILAALKEIAPRTPVVAEEEVAAGRTPVIGAEFVLVDPLDGTKEFLRGDDSRGEFTVNIGLVRDGEPVAGVVFAPALGRLWAARPGAAWTIDVVDGVSTGPGRPIATRTPPDAGLTAVASRSHRTPETDAFLEAYPVTDFRSAGSSLKFCLVAEGEADLYPRLGRTMEWDTAAGDAVLRAAGGRTVTLDGAPLAYGKREQPDDSDFANPHFAALGQLALATEP